MSVVLASCFPQFPLSESEWKRSRALGDVEEQSGRMSICQQLVNLFCSELMAPK